MRRMRRLFPRVYGALRAAGYSEERASRILLDARRRDACAMVAVRCAVQSRRPRFAFLVELLEESA